MAKRGRRKKQIKTKENTTKEDFVNSLLQNLLTYCNGDATLLLEACANITAKSLYLVREDAVFAETGEPPSMEFLISNFSENLTTFTKQIKIQVDAYKAEREAEGETVVDD